MKKEMLILFLLILAGIFSTQLFGSDFFAEYGFLNEYHLQLFADAKLDRVALFWNVFWERGKLFLVFALLGITPLKQLLPLLMKCAFGYTIGLYGAACVMNLGGAGFGVLLLSLLPHGIFYLLALIGLFYLERPMIYREKKYVFRRVLAVVLLVILLTAGCLLETAVSTFLLQAFLKRFVFM